MLTFPFIAIYLIIRVIKKRAFLRANFVGFTTN
jgi:hypothetical protein